MHGQTQSATMIGHSQPIPLTTDAAKAVGSRRASDYDRMGGIDLESQINGFADAAAAGPLAAVLRSDDVKTVAAGYNTDNRNAIRRQRRFKWLGRIAIWAAFLASMAGALYLFPILGVHQLPQLRSSLVLIGLACVLT